MVCYASDLQQPRLVLMLIGHDADSDWAAIYNLVKVGDEYKFSKIHIIAVSYLLPVCMRGGK